jgi:hypothetical protein
MKRSLSFLFLFMSAGISLTAQTACSGGALPWHQGGNSGTGFNNSLGTCNRLDLLFKTNDTTRIRIDAEGRLFFGKHRIKSTHPHSNSFMQVDGKLACKELVVVDPNKWSDFVFDAGYRPLSLFQLEEFYLHHRHLPDVPSEKEIKRSGINVAEMDALLLRKIEELTLYIVALNKEVEQLKTAIKNPGSNR